MRDIAKAIERLKIKLIAVAKRIKFPRFNYKKYSSQTENQGFMTIEEMIPKETKIKIYKMVS